MMEILYYFLALLVLSFVILIPFIFVGSHANEEKKHADWAKNIENQVQPLDRDQSIEETHETVIHNVWRISYFLFGILLCVVFALAVNYSKS